MPRDVLQASSCRHTGRKSLETVNLLQFAAIYSLEAKRLGCFSCQRGAR